MTSYNGRYGYGFWTLSWVFLALCIVIGLFVNPAYASGTYPNRPVKLVVPWTPGGNVDSVARLIASRLSAKIGQPVVVENKSGANGIIGTEYVSKALPDGYTLIIANAETHSINPSVYRSLSYDPIKNFSPVMGFGQMAFVLAARVGLPANTLDQVIALAKSQPNKLTFGSWGVGSVPHFAMELLMDQTRTVMLHVPYRGGPEVYSALMAGQVDLATFPPYMAKPLAESGKLKLISLFGKDRDMSIPAVPTTEEEGYDVEVASALGLLAPAGTPARIIDYLSEQLTLVMKMPQVQKDLRAQGISIDLKNSKEYGAYLVEERQRWADIVKRRGLTLQ